MPSLPYLLLHDFLNDMFVKYTNNKYTAWRTYDMRTLFPKEVQKYHKDWSSFRGSKQLKYNHRHSVQWKLTRCSLLRRLKLLNMGMEYRKKIPTLLQETVSAAMAWLTDGKSKCLKILKNPLQEYCDDGLLAFGVYCRRLNTSINFENDPWEQKTLWF